MIAALRFDTPIPSPEGRTLRRASFVPRSTLPLSAACLVANGVRETLARLLARDVEVELVEPVIPGPNERRTLLAGATIVRVRGRICDGFVIVRPRAARALAALAFGEHERPEDVALSEIERTTVDRAVGAFVPLCNALCGTLGPSAHESSERAACDIVTYFEVRTTGPGSVAVGFALTRDPAEEVSEPLELADLADVELSCTAHLGTGRLDVRAFSRLAPGATVLLETQLGAPGTLRFGDVAFARGTCGVRDGRHVIEIACVDER